jgi:hypothetical protein
MFESVTFDTDEELFDFLSDRGVKPLPVENLDLTDLDAVDEYISRCIGDPDPSLLFDYNLDAPSDILGEYPELLYSFDTFGQGLSALGFDYPLYFDEPDEPIAGFDSVDVSCQVPFEVISIGEENEFSIPIVKGGLETTVANGSTVIQQGDSRNLDRLSETLIESARSLHNRRNAKVDYSDVCAYLEDLKEFADLRRIYFCNLLGLDSNSDNFVDVRWQPGDHTFWHMSKFSKTRSNFDPYGSKTDTFPEYSRRGLVFSFGPESNQSSGTYDKT